MDVYQRRRERLRLLLKDISAADLSRRSGVAASLITRYKDDADARGAKNLGEENARKLEAAAGKPPGWLDKQHSPEGASEPWVAHTMSHQPSHHPSRSRVEVPVRCTGRPTPTGGLVLEDHHSGGVVDAAFAGPQAFAIKIAGDALYPAVRNGVFLVCDPEAPCVSGEPVLLELADGRLLVRELVVERGDEITTTSLTGADRETISRGDVKAVIAITMTVYASRWRDTAADAPRLAASAPPEAGPAPIRSADAEVAASRGHGATRKSK